MMLYTISWSQPYQGWPEPEIVDLTQAREVLARIMAL
jgi:hypothetical protein